MIINGEKANAFSATTLSIPKPPNDLTPRIIEYSRNTYAKPKAEVEALIAANIAAADKFKEDLSNSGRAAGERGSQAQAKDNKPTFKFQPTLQQEFRKQKISPNAAQGEDENAGNGLRNLGKLFAEKTAVVSPNIQTEKTPEKAETKAEEPKLVISSGDLRNSKPQQNKPQQGNNSQNKRNNHRNNNRNHNQQKDAK